MATNYTKETYVVVTLTVILALQNSFLMYLASKIRPRTRDIILIIIISTIEYLAPVIGWTGLILLYIGETGDRHIPKCQPLGFLFAFGYYSGVIFNLLLALDRLSKIVDRDLLRYFYLPLGAIYTSFVGLLLTCAIKGLLVQSSSYMVCTIIPGNTLLLTITYYHFVISMLIALFIITYCYLRIAIYTTNQTQFMVIKTDHDDSQISIKRTWNVRIVAIRIFFILAIYILCFFSSVLCILAEGVLLSLYGKGGKLQAILAAISIMLYILGTTANASLLLFIHHNISKQRKAFIQRVKVLFTRR